MLDSYYLEQIDKNIVFEYVVPDDDEMEKQNKKTRLNIAEVLRRLIRNWIKLSEATLENNIYIKLCYHAEKDMRIINHTLKLVLVIFSLNFTNAFSSSSVSITY